MPREEFVREVEKELTGRDSEPHEIMYFKIYREPDSGHRAALETAALMLGTNVPRLLPEMICADFLRSAPRGGKPKYCCCPSSSSSFLPGEQKHAFLEQVNAASSFIPPKRPLSG
jgi:hypothetical protein